MDSESPQSSQARADNAANPAGGKRILLHAHRDLRQHVSPQAAAQRDLFGENAGNTVFAHAVQRTLSAAGSRIEVRPFAPPPATAAKINETFDQYVIPLANAFRPSFRHRLDEFSESIEQLRIPVVVVGIGVQLATSADNASRLDSMRPSIERFMRAVLALSDSVGVRGEATYNYLRGIGFSDSDMTVIGCPSLFQYGDTLRVREYQGLGRDSLVTLNLSPYRAAMGPIAKANTARYPNMHYVAQDIATLRTMLYSVEAPDTGKYGSDIPCRVDDELLRTGRTDFFVDPTTWAKWLGARDVSFGSRIHGNIVSLLGGTPAVVLAHDSRTLELAEYHEIPHRILSDVPADVDPRDLFETADFDGFHRNQGERFLRYLKFLDDNGLDHIFRGNAADNAAVAEFDAQVEAARNKRPVVSAGPTLASVRRQRLRAREVGSAVLQKVRSMR